MTRLMVVVAAVWLGSVPAAAAQCLELKGLSLPNMTITSAGEVTSGSFVAPAAANSQQAPPTFANLPAFCRVTAVARPSRDSEINLEVWLPSGTWNTRFQPVGTGLWGGAINYNGLANMLRAGYATANTDMGHVGPGASFALGHPEKVEDFGYRAFHEMTILAKAAIRQFYGKPQTLSLVDQCGGAGRGALEEIRRYPDAYDVVAAAGIDPETTRHSMGQLWVWQAAHKTPESAIPASKLPLLHRNSLNACDAKDGIADGIIADPRSCNVDPAVLQCKGGDGPDCLTAAQVEAARTIYSPVVNPRTRETLFGPLTPGSEPGWGGQIGPEPFGYGTDFFRYLVFKDPDWHPRTRPVDFDRDIPAAESRENLVVNVEPNINRFLDRGGKLLIVGGWADTAIAPASNTNFYERVVKNAGRRADNSVRLFMVPDMGHCPAAPDAQNGYVVDTGGILEQWQRTGQAPNSIVVSRRVNGAEERKLLVCRYPQAARYKGAGDPKSPESFECR
jgi:feruloyl esterase